MSDGLLLRDVRCGLSGPLVDVEIAGGRIERIGPRGSGAVPVGPVGPVDPAGPADPASVDAGGATLLRGLWDRHVHLRQWALRRTGVDLAGVRDPRAAAARLRAAAAASPGAVLAYGASPALLAALDADEHPDRLHDGPPVLVQTPDLHSSWITAAAARLAGTGERAGLLRERDSFTASRRLSAAADVEDALRTALDDAAALGVVGVLDFEMTDNVHDWPRRAAAAPLPVRIDCSIPRDRVDAAVAAGLRTGQVLDDAGLVRVGPVKTFVDGSLGSATALCTAPYPDGGHGRQEIDAAELTALVAHAGAHGLAVAAHAIGDAAAGIALDAFAAAGHGGRIEHAQLLRASDLARFAELGVVAGVQPAHLLDDRDLADELWAGQPGRGYAYAELLAAGAVVEFGSDAPVSPLDPWRGVRAAVARTGDERPAWHEEQRVSLAAALDASTGGRATPRTGDAADLVLYDGDPGDPAPGADDGAGTRVLGTLLAGRWTYRA